MKLISKYQYGAFINSLPKNQLPTSDFNVYRYWELNGKPANFLQAIAKGMYVFNPFDGRFHANTVAYNKDTDEYEFMKSWDHPTVDYELLWYFNSPEAADFRKTYGLDMDSTPYKYINKNKHINKNTKGGKINIYRKGNKIDKFELIRPYNGKIKTQVGDYIEIDRDDFLKLYPEFIEVYKNIPQKSFVLKKDKNGYRPLRNTGIEADEYDKLYRLKFNINKSKTNLDTNVSNNYFNDENQKRIQNLSLLIIDSQIKQSSFYQKMLARKSDLITSDRTDLMPYIRDLIYRMSNTGYPPADYFMDTKHKQKEHFIKDGWIEGDSKDYGLVQKQAEAFNKNAHTTLPVYKKSKDYINKDELIPIGQIHNIAGFFTPQKELRDAWLGNPDSGLGSYNAGNFPTQVYIDKDNNLYQEAWDLNDYGDLADSGGQTSKLSIITNLYDLIGNPTVVTTGIQPIITPSGKNANISDTTDMYPDKYIPLKKIIEEYYK